MGLIAICHACQVRDRYANRDIEGALQSSTNAQKWAIRAIVTGTIMIIAAVIFHIINANNTDVS